MLNESRMTWAVLSNRPLEVANELLAGCRPSEHTLIGVYSQVVAGPRQGHV